jgi:hypothetical protein
MRTELRRCYRIRELPDVAGDFQTLLRFFAIRKALPLVEVNELNRLIVLVLADVEVVNSNNRLPILD